MYEPPQNFQIESTIIRMPEQAKGEMRTKEERQETTECPPSNERFRTYVKNANLFVNLDSLNTL